MIPLQYQAIAVQSEPIADPPLINIECFMLTPLFDPFSPRRPEACVNPGQMTIRRVEFSIVHWPVVDRIQPRRHQWRESPRLSGVFVKKN
jgi:hypothetical protein